MTMDDEVEEAKLAQALAEVPKGSVVDSSSRTSGRRSSRSLDRSCSAPGRCGRAAHYTAVRPIPSCANPCRRALYE